MLASEGSYITLKDLNPIVYNISMTVRLGMLEFKKNRIQIRLDYKVKQEGRFL